MKIPNSSVFRVYYQLDPCPFCKGEARLIRRRPIKYLDGERLVAYVKCQNCHARSGFKALDDFDRIEDAWEATVNGWNHREPLPF